MLSHFFYLLAFSFLPKETPSGSFCDYPTYAFEQLNLSRATKISECHVPRYYRVNWRDRDSKYYLKTWPKKYPRINAFLTALERGLYDEITPLEGIFFDREGVCRGYFTRAYKTPGGNLRLHTIEKDGRTVIFPLKKQPDGFRRLFEKLLENTRASGMVYVDLHSANTVYDQKTSQFYLIDLESAYSLEELSNPSSKDHRLRNAPPEYLIFLKEEKLFPQAS